MNAIKIRNFLFFFIISLICSITVFAEDIKIPKNYSDDYIYCAKQTNVFNINFVSKKFKNIAFCKSDEERVSKLSFKEISLAAENIIYLKSGTPLYDIYFKQKAGVSKTYSFVGILEEDDKYFYVKAPDRGINYYLKKTDINYTKENKNIVKNNKNWFSYNGNIYRSIYFSDNKNLIKIQSNLKTLGLYKSSIDGVVGPKTISSVLDWKTYFDIKNDNQNFFDETHFSLLEYHVMVHLSNKESNQSADEIQQNQILIPASSGSGFLINSSGYIISNNHVIEGCDTIKVFKDSKEYEANIIAVDSVNDLSLSKIDISNKNYFRIADTDALLLDDIIVAGFPLGKKVSASIKTSKGSITSLAGFGDNYSNFQMDAALNPGNSGGPIINNKGNVIGVAVAGFGKKEGVESFNFGIKSSVLNTFIQSNSISLNNPNNQELSNSDLGKLIVDSTLYMECWMTESKLRAMIKDENSQKAFFKIN